MSQGQPNYQHEVISAMVSFLDDLMNYNFAHSKAMVLWLRAKPAAQKMFRDLDNSGDENLRNLAQKLKAIVEAAQRDGLYSEECSDGGRK